MHHHENEQVCVVLEGEMVVHTEDDSVTLLGSTTPSGWRPTNPTASRTRATNARSVSTYSRRAAASTTGPTAKSSTADRHWAVDHDQRLVPMTDTTSSATPGGMDFSESSELGLVKSQIDRFIEREVRRSRVRRPVPGRTGRGEPTGRERLPSSTNTSTSGRRYASSPPEVAGFLTMHMPESVGGGG